MLNHWAKAARFLPASNFGRNVGVLAGGTVLAQVTMALALPLLTRLYSPEDFSLLAVYMSVLGIVTAVACLRLNLAVPLPEDDRQSMDLVALSLIAAAVICLGLTLPVIFAPEMSAELLGQPRMAEYLWMIPVGVFAAAVYNALQYWSSRKGRFPLIARTRMTRAVGGSVTQVGMGLVHPVPFGLLIGHILYSGLGVIGLAREMWRSDRSLFAAFNATAASAALRRYRRFPLYSVPEAMLNTGGVQLPVLLIAGLSTGPEVGFLGLAMQVIGVPMALLGSSVAQVYVADAPRQLRDGTLSSFTRQAMKNLMKVGGLTLLAIGAMSPLLFPYVFGDDWTRAGVIVAWMTPCYVLQFVTSPVSTVLQVTGGLFAAMTLQLVGFGLRVGSVLAAAHWLPSRLVEAYACSGVVFYAIYMLVIRGVLARHE